MKNNQKDASENFKDWFGGSKVVDKYGEPLVVYHGTSGDIESFDPSRSGSKSKTGAPEGTFFFSDSGDVASSYTVKWQGDFSSQHHPQANVIPVHLRMERPLKISAKGESWREIEFKKEFLDINEIARIAKDSGKYDGMIVSRISDKGVGDVRQKLSTTYVAFSPLQIKSIFNSGEYLRDSPDLLDKRVSRANEALKYIEAKTRKMGLHA